jgi:hypothetical protein
MLLNAERGLHPIANRSIRSGFFVHAGKLSRPEVSVDCTCRPMRITKSFLTFRNHRQGRLAQPTECPHQQNSGPLGQRALPKKRLEKSKSF